MFFVYVVHAPTERLHNILCDACNIIYIMLVTP